MAGALAEADKRNRGEPVVDEASWGRIYGWSGTTVVPPSVRA
jgi:hypothetical protein